MKRLRKLAASLPKSAKLSFNHASKLKGGAGGSDSGHDKRSSSSEDGASGSGG